MTESNEQTRSTAEPQPDYRKKWVVPKRKRGGVEKIHLMNTNDEAFCGRHITPDPKKILDFDDYCPLDHKDKVCPKCLEWWNSIRPGKYGRKKASINS